MNPRTGRPKAENPLSIEAKVRMDKETDLKLTEYCKKNGLNRAEAIRKGIHLLLAKK